ncbi:MAG: hypothetical protein FD170_2394 [Bacteroidetes bacterium]|nr:MAG: hypothetical protein FD170_2394 [Bacteroidota bacterium]
MLIGKLVLKLLPIRYYYQARNIYRKYHKAIYKELSETDLHKILVESMGIKNGDVIFVHSSIDRLNISASPFKILNILQEVVGSNGTLLFPAWHFTERAELYLKKNKVFDVRKAPVALGLLPEIARRSPLAKRSIHPTNSIVAIGKQADELLMQHGDSIYPCDELSPFYKMMKLNAKIIGLGVTTEFLSFVHCPEDVMKADFPVKTRSDVVFETNVIDHDGNTRIISTLVADKTIATRNIPGFIKAFVDPEIARDFHFRGNHFFIADSKELYKIIERLALKDITIYS